MATATLPSERLSVSEREAAKLIGISPRKLSTMRKRGEVPHARLTGRILYPLPELRAWLSSRTVTVAPSQVND